MQEKRSDDHRKDDGCQDMMGGGIDTGADQPAHTAEYCDEKHCPERVEEKEFSEGNPGFQDDRYGKEDAYADQELDDEEKGSRVAIYDMPG